MSASLFISDTRIALASDAIERARAQVSGSLDRGVRGRFGQFMTPKRLAKFMADLFDAPQSQVRLLDAGAGMGALSAAFVEKMLADRIAASSQVAVTAYEVDPALCAQLDEYADACRNSGSTLLYRVLREDFIESAVSHLQFGTGERFTHAILNPPYRKIASSSPHRQLLRSVGIETVNLYTAFVALAVALMEPGGEVVAIIPRSFCNGLYYRPFRKWLFNRAALTHIHLFESRTSAFSDDKVLQENVIVKLRCARPQQAVTISTSTDATFTDVSRRDCDFADIVMSDDAAQFIHIPAAHSRGTPTTLPIATSHLSDVGLSVATGPVVDFRLKDHLRADPDSTTVPLLYPTHFAGSSLQWPKQGKKPNALQLNEATKKWLMPAGFYTVVRRFTAKEERRRIVASVVDPALLPDKEIGFENHLNVFHADKSGLEADVAFGLAAYLNSTAVDEYFRLFSGHTQVNATDLRRIKYPSREALIALGQWARSAGAPTQQDIDTRLEGYGNQG